MPFTPGLWPRECHHYKGCGSDLAERNPESGLQQDGRLARSKIFILGRSSPSLYELGGLKNSCRADLEHAMDCQ